eukprot:m.116416 g.116416  ORF g.116416 m.116416 type:complete len:471 (+) comp13134_c1_seq1:157-1569(+)
MEMEILPVSPIRMKRNLSPPKSPQAKRARQTVDIGNNSSPARGCVPLRSAEDSLCMMFGQQSVYTPPAPAAQRLSFDAPRSAVTVPQLCSPSDIVRIDVGGTVFKTRRATVTSVGGSLLAELFSKHGVNSAFIDRDARYFEMILGWLRDRASPVEWPIHDPTFIREVHHYRLTQEILGEGQLFVVGGEDDDGPYDSTALFSPVSLEWSSDCVAPLRMDALGCTSLGGVPYICGGYDDRGKKLKFTFRYIASSKRWERLADLTVARSRHQLVAADGMLYAFGGLLSKTGIEDHGEHFFERFDPATNRWTVIPSKMEARYGFAAVAHGHHIFVIGGLTVEGSRVATVERLDTRSGACERLPDIPSPRAFLSCTVLGGQIFAMGGNDLANMPCTTVEILDVHTETWRAGPDLPSRRCDGCAATLNGLVYLCGGEDDENYLRTVDIFDPAEGTWSEGPPLPEAKSSIAACVVAF